jgi:hypothetical protein
MSVRRQTNPYRALATLKIALAGLVVLAAGVLCLYIGGLDDHFWSTHQSMQALLDHLGSALVISVGLGAVWEFVGKRAFALEVLERAKTSTDVVEVGLKRIGTDYRTVPDWPEMFRTVRHLDVFAAYASTWRNNYLAELRRVAERSGGRIRVFLPDPKDDQTVAMLAARFSISEEELRRRINETADGFLSMRQPHGAQIDVYYASGDRMFTFYVFDDTAVMTLYRHKPDRSAVIPTLVLETGGTWYDFLQEEIASLLDRSRVAQPSELCLRQRRKDILCKRYANLASSAMMTSMSGWRLSSAGLSASRGISRRPDSTLRPIVSAPYSCMHQASEQQ